MWSQRDAKTREGFIESSADWIYSSALDYEGRKGLIDIYFLD